MEEIKISILNKDNKKLIGIESIPSIKKSKFPTVLLVHGFGATKSEHGLLDELAKNLSQKGILAYRFDFTGCGESEGDFSNATLSSSISDLSDILNFIRSQDKVDNSKIGILGFSYGALSVIALNPDVNNIIFMSTSPFAEKIISKLFGKGYNPNAISQRTSSRGFTIKLNSDFWKDLKCYSLNNLISKVKVPLLFIHGSKDNIVPISDMEGYFNFANNPKEKIIIEGAGHLMKSYRDEVSKIVSDWFNIHLNN